MVQDEQVEGFGIRCSHYINMGKLGGCIEGRDK